MSHFSIAMATYNGARFLREQLDSFLAQELLPQELVVCDDASSDETTDIAREFATRAPFPVRIEVNERTLGPSENFLKAASLCRAEWIAFSDQDDVWDRRKLSTLSRVIDAHPSLRLVAHRARLVDVHLRPLGGLLGVPVVQRLTVHRRLTLSPWLYPYGFTIAFHREVLQDFPFGGRPVPSHDRWVFVVANAIGDVAFLPDALALYRRHDANVSQLRGPASVVADALRVRDYAEVIEIAEGLARYFAERAAAGGAHQAMMRSAAAVYAKQSQFLQSRQAMESFSSFSLDRLKAFSGMLLSGAYGSWNSGGLGWRAAVKDVARPFRDAFAQLSRAER